MHVTHLIIIIIILIITTTLIHGEDAVACLEGFKSSLRDPQSRLIDWKFNNRTSGFICRFTNVKCWKDQENRVLELSPRDSFLAGPFPSDLQLCKSLVILDLSGNNITGSVPNELCKWLPYLVTLKLSGNQLTGEIPIGLGNCSFLNVLDLSGNRLSGNIPVQISNLDKLKTFNVADNELSGGIPWSLGKFGSDSFDGNKGLCGKPLGSCAGLNNKNLGIIVAAGVFGAAGGLLVGFGVWWCHGRFLRG